MMIFSGNLLFIYNQKVSQAKFWNTSEWDREFAFDKIVMLNSKLCSGAQGTGDCVGAETD